MLFRIKSGDKDSKKHKMTFKTIDLTLFVSKPFWVWASLAQLVEHSICNRTVVGSSPTTGSIPIDFPILTSVACIKHFPG